MFPWANGEATSLYILIFIRSSWWCESRCFQEIGAWRGNLAAEKDAASSKIGQNLMSWNCAIHELRTSQGMWDEMSSKITLISGLGISIYNDSHSKRYIHLLHMKYIHFWWIVHCYASLPLDTTLTGWSRVIFCPRNPKERDFYGFLVDGKPPTWTPTRHPRNKSYFFTPWSAKSQLLEGQNLWAQHAGLIFPSKYTQKNLGLTCFQALIGRIFCPHGSFMCSWTKCRVRNSRKFQCPMGSPLRPLASKIPHHRSKQGHFFQMCLGIFFWWE